MPAEPRVLHFGVSIDRAGDARSALGGSPLAREVEWWAEHLVLAGLVRCTLASMDYSARRAGLNSLGVGSAHGIVTKREEDGLYAFVEIETTLEIELAPAPAQPTLRELVGRAEHGCFVSNSLIARPRHRWIVNGEEVAR
ncbi:MAG TPA: OsmC family protein [Gaiellaceae bacterium]|nr:OsmC family protein [Gaiellaceae bacterium]